ncbi:MAG: PorP/SprF family type IX secretion system membrane protein [Ferruginibacter sp.]
MKTPRFLSFLISGLLFTAPLTYGQDIHFSQIFETPLLRNPALAGIFTGDVRIQSVYRSQWNSVTDAYKTVSLNGEYKLPVGNGDDYLTIGAQVLYDRAGTVALTSTHLLPAINYHKSLSAEKNMYISMAFMGGLVQRNIDRSKMTTNNQFNGTGYDGGLNNGETFSNPNYSYLDGSAGMSFNTQLGENADNNLILGVAYHHFNQAKKISFYSSNEYEMKPKWVGSAGVRMGITDYSFLTIQADYSQQGTYTETIAGMLYSWKLDDWENPRYILHAGAYFRLKDAMIPVVKLECKPIAIAVSYDANISPLKSASQGRGGFELSLSWQKYLDKYNSSRDAVRCPKF